MSAFLVLAATKARDSNGGFYLENRTKSLQLSYLDVDGRQHFLYARRIQDQSHVHDANGRLESHGLYDSVLRRRGWVLQEQVLARRTLSFAKDEMLWGCRECSTCECRIGFSNFESEAISPSREVYKDIYSNWYIMLEAYSHRPLTYQIDKLPAISGIAKLLHDMTQDGYYAGLWRSQLPGALLWTSKKDNNEYTESEKCMPSWSWASIRSGGITYDHKDEKFKAGTEIVSVDIQLSGSNAFGGVLGGYKRIAMFGINLHHGFQGEKGTLKRIMILVDLDQNYYDQNKPTESAIEVKKNISLFLMFVGTRTLTQYAETPSFLALRYLEEDERGNSIFMRAGIAALNGWSTHLLDRVRAATKESIVLI
ncbi:uncharacterized protein EAE97_004021 [Botrytis byssoidea]|uniref:Heterokaryon incompatibility domain-containing protein n=1 Tax=Botrytis byssoidea TaxID=139641 RepID=A0A9P5IRU5_9HELO|nr:uncharacterized protein EAE97_004021 [Botrytis byssoidea]KAF7948610.1 hypothetical protein EAE97_004021 [Botrytis byssoidea]